MTGNSQRSDSDLLESLRSGDYRAFEEIYARYWARLFKSANNLLRDQEQSIDLLQEIFVSLWIKRESVTIENLSAYLYGAVRFQVSNHIRHQKIRESFFDEVKALSLRFETQDRYDIVELEDVLDKGINRLPRKCREIFRLSRYEHLSHKEIADRMGISARTVENQIGIALKRLRISVGDFLTVFVSTFFW